MRKYILIAGVAVILGSIIGGTAVSFHLSRSLDDIKEILSLNYRADWEHRAYQAYSKESPQVSIWALKNLVDVLNTHEKYATEEAREIIQSDLMFTYVRLALCSKQEDDQDGYEKSISKALSIAKRKNPERLSTEEELIAFVEKVDETVLIEEQSGS